MVTLIMGIAHAKAFVLDLTPPATSKRQKRRIATYPLLTTRGFHERRLGIATEPAMLAGNRLGFHSVVCHGLFLFVGMGCSGRERAREVHRATHRSILCDHLHLNPTPLPPH